MRDVPAFATSDALIVAVSCVAETNIVVRAEPLNFTADVGIKLVPFIVMLKAGPPALAEPGLNEAIDGVCAVGAGVGAGVGIGAPLEGDGSGH